MPNEILLIGSVAIIYGTVLIAYRLFGKIGMYAMTVIATILANVEVLLLVDGFGMEQTLGNVMQKKLQLQNQLQQQKLLQLNNYC